MKRLIAILLTSLLLGLVPAAQAEARTFKNCVELRKTFKHGVSLNKSAVNRGAGPIFSPRVNAAVYRLNKKMDLDRDNIICEVVRPKPKPVVVPSPTPEPTVAPTPTPTPTPTDLTYENPSVASDPIGLCKLEEVSWARRNYPEDKMFTWSGFPDLKPATTRSGVVKWALIPIDFSDLPGEPDFRTRVDGEMKLLSDWVESVSEGRLKVEWVVLDRWVRLPGRTANYEIPRSLNLRDAPNGPKLFRDAMDSADPVFDFTGIQTVNFILPKGQTFIGEGSQGFPWDEAVLEYTSNEGKIASFSIPGRFFDLEGRDYWAYWAHEFGHAIGLPHVGGWSGFPPFNPWDMMGGQDGPSRELSGWLRFLAGWLSNDQIYCKEARRLSSVDMTLVPLSARQPGVKFAVVPISKTKAVLVESRRDTKFSCVTNPQQNGVLVYTYDATLGHGEDFLKPVIPQWRPTLSSECSGIPLPPDPLLRTGDKVTIEGVTIEVLQHRNLDKIRITRN